MKDQEFREIGRQVVDIARKAVTDVVDFVAQQANESDICQRVVEGASELTGKRPRIPVRISRAAGGLFLEAELPGCSTDDVDIVVLEDTVTIRRGATTEADYGTIVKNEFGEGAAERVVRLPEKVDPNKVAARMARGVLTVELYFNAGKKVTIVDTEVG